ncbi:hypothetical protein [Cyanobium sp. CH-040]|uniref:hypothetical protein n=1 Tax=Cyanobium sp. CH-040 TaxID=2823708 RepID=UPI0020CDE9A6|nr:hypothetical protein [Cyanobium sp. CH-040]MCP9928148.1 hypothetical protein [Cyanobium sp. CH-040]
MLRSPHAWIATAAFTLATALGLPASAQGQAPAAAARPISQDAMNDMALAAAVSVCEMAVEEKVAVEKTVLSAAKAMTYVVTNRYGSQVANAGRLQPEQIANGSIIQIIGRVRQGCYDKLNAADKKFVDNIISEYNKAVQSQGQGQRR